MEPIFFHSVFPSTLNDTWWWNVSAAVNHEQNMCSPFLSPNFSRLLFPLVQNSFVGEKETIFCSIKRFAKIYYIFLLLPYIIWDILQTKTHLFSRFYFYTPLLRSTKIETYFRWNPWLWLSKLVNHLANRFVCV